MSTERTHDGKENALKKKILGAALGTCVHVGGLHHFLKLAEAEGYTTVSLGPAVSIERLISEIAKEQPSLVAISYRLTPEVASTLFNDLKKAMKQSGLPATRFVFGGTPPAAAVALASGLFEKTFNGEEPFGAVKAYLRGGGGKEAERQFAHDLIGRIGEKYPYPLLRHHFGRPSVEESVRGAAEIAGAGVLDILSIGTDQNAQEHFFHQDEMDHSQDGAGGVPVRTPEDLRAIYEATRCGNYPLVRCYSGTRDLLQWAEMSVRTINNAWAAIPLCWYSVMDGRSQVPLREAITEKQSAMKWYAERGIPVEVNESHQWSLRDAHDSLAVTMAFLAAYNAKKMGVRHYVSQFMFNTPPGTWPRMDIAKMMAKNELIESLSGKDFTVYREVRAGIAHFSSNPNIAQGQLASSAVISLSLRPHILHVVGFSEGSHATHPGELVQSCDIVHGVLQNCLQGLPDMGTDPGVHTRKEELLGEAADLLDAIRRLGEGAAEDPWSSPKVLAHAIRHGLLDAPHFRGNPHLCGRITTRLRDGGWYATDSATGEAVSEKRRTDALLKVIPPLD